MLPLAIAVILAASANLAYGVDRFTDGSDVVKSLESVGIPVTPDLVLRTAIVNWDVPTFSKDKPFRIHGNIIGICSVDQSKPDFCPCSGKPRMFKAAITYKVQGAIDLKNPKLERESLAFDRQCVNKNKQPVILGNKLYEAIGAMFSDVIYGVFPQLRFTDRVEVMIALSPPEHPFRLRRKYEQYGLVEHGLTLTWTTDFTTADKDFSVTARLVLVRNAKEEKAKGLLAPVPKSGKSTWEFSYQIKDLLKEHPFAQATFAAKSGDKDEDKFFGDMAMEDRMQDTVVFAVKDSLDSVLQYVFPRIIVSRFSAAKILNKFVFEQSSEMTIPRLSVNQLWLFNNDLGFSTPKQAKTRTGEVIYQAPFVVTASLDGKCEGDPKMLPPECPCPRFRALVRYTIEGLMRERGTIIEHTPFSFVDKDEKGRALSLCKPQTTDLPNALKSGPLLTIMHAFPNLFADEQAVTRRLSQQIFRPSLAGLSAVVHWKMNCRDYKFNDEVDKKTATYKKPFEVVATYSGDCANADKDKKCPCAKFEASVTYRIEDLTAAAGKATIVHPMEFRTLFSYVDFDAIDRLRSNAKPMDLATKTECKPTTTDLMDDLKKGAEQSIKAAYPNLKLE